MKTMYYYYVLAVLGLVFALNSCDTIESSEKIEERNRAATTAYISNMYDGLSCEVEEISICRTDTLSAKQFIKDMERLMGIVSNVASKKQMDFLMDMKRRLKGQPTIISYSFDVKYTTKIDPKDVMTDHLYGLYNTKSKEFVVGSNFIFLWDKSMPKIYCEVLLLNKELQK